MQARLANGFCAIWDNCVQDCLRRTVALYEASLSLFFLYMLTLLGVDTSVPKPSWALGLGFCVLWFVIRAGVSDEF